MSWEQRFETKPRRTAFNVLVSIVLILIAAGAVGGAAVWAINLFSQPAKVISKTMDADNVIANYEWFKRQVQDVKAMDVRLVAASMARDEFVASAGDRAAWTFDDKQEWNRLNTILLGLRGQRAAMVAEYNARTQMANRDLFRTNDLPETLQ